MQFQMEAIIGEANEYMHRRNRLVSEDQARADYLLKTLSQIKGSSAVQWLIAFYWAAGFIIVLCGVGSLWNVMFSGIPASSEAEAIFEIVSICVFIFWTILGLIFYFVWRRPRRRRLISKFRYELATDSRLRSVFKHMNLVDP